MSTFVVIALAVCWAGFGACLACFLLITAYRRSARRKLFRGVGTWRRTGYSLLPYQCTACGVYREDTTQYCPHCGRPMRLEEDNGEE